MIAALAAERERQGVSQKQLAELTGTTQSAISELESGITRDPRMSTIEKIAEALGVDLTWTFTPTRPASEPLNLQ